MLELRARLLLRAALVVAPLALALSACETMEKLNPFAEKQTPLPGVRKPLFPEGVPGVEFGAAQPQPARPAASKSKTGNPDDAWDGTR
jgi:hypothetical protein